MNFVVLMSLIRPLDMYQGLNQPNRALMSMRVLRSQLGPLDVHQGLKQLNIVFNKYEGINQSIMIVGCASGS